MKIPSIVKANFLNQLEQCLHIINVRSSLSLFFSLKIIENHIPFSLILKSIDECDDFSYELVPIKKIFSIPLEGFTGIIALSKQGDSFILERNKGDQIFLKSYFNVGNEVFSRCGALSNLIKDFDLVDQALILYENKMKSKKIEKNYTLKHFFSHKKTILSIIGSSVFMALLGVATPLGFQTFTDKILPYSATGSLYVVATFLLLSAIASSVFKCFHDFQENVLLAKYQNGLGKDVFNRLLDMEISYFDQHKVGDLTKLVDQVKEASNFLIRQALASVVSVISLVIVLPILFIYSAKLTGIVLLIGLGMAITIGVALKPIRLRVMRAYGYDASFQSTLIEILKGIKTIKSLTNESYFRNRANISLETNLYGGFNVSRLSNVVSALVNFQSQLITIAVIFLVLNPFFLTS
ncbi:ABC transporter transmembrane domain-containing protein [Marinomonas sp. 15G1-11]|uniref:ABC transporter transmembrane domain-containing protein n=1 Tax=Marinomonas phaeophyticola TaxID=3004091 RepID=A0ABT4JQR6_9GAMM|nr:ABC transporter transmembrane domain-containing protein [Marinomonas sp. 15G1-11]MCZ2720168.1 ABC transporter transmembrane domain-containing protein [Marinomonas sp. 15G1-11]